MLCLRDQLSNDGLAQILFIHVMHFKKSCMIMSQEGERVKSEIILSY